MSLNIYSFSLQIEKAFKSLMQSGRPDILDEDNNSLISDLYVDLFDNNYVLNQVIDSNHTLLNGRRGTGKSTIFLQAEELLQENPFQVAVYINLQTCYEEVKSSKSDDTNNNLLTKYLTFKNFLNEILMKIKEYIGKKIKNDEEFNQLFERISKGDYIDQDFQRSLQLTSTKVVNHVDSFDMSSDLKSFSANFKFDDSSKEEVGLAGNINELRIFSIHSIIKEITRILEKYKIRNVFLFLDDFSELSMESQKVVIDSLVAPIISSYNDYFKIKIAAYPGRIYTGNIDMTKLPTYPLDFYDAFESSSTTYNTIEELAIYYVERTLKKRLEVFTKNEVSIEEIFDLNGEWNLDDYMKTLFYCSSGIPRSLGFILNYCYLSSIHMGKPITKVNINAAAEKYFTNNILADFINDARFKQAFYDDKDLLDQIAQKNLMDKICEKLFNTKREIIDQFQKGTLKSIFVDTLTSYRKGTVYWLPSSHFYIKKESEKILKTLELYFIVTKFNEGSTNKEVGKKISYYGLNYGLCLTKKIDYGRPTFRRTYDYWRQEEFDLNEFIPSVLSDIEIVSCEACGRKYDEIELSIYMKNKNCFQCTAHNTVKSVNKFQNKFRKKLEEWSEKKLPNAHIEILRTLYNNRDNELSAFEIGTQIDRHHLGVTQAMKRLTRDEFVDMKERDKRYYKITDSAVSRFFSESIEDLLNL